MYLRYQTRLCSFELILCVYKIDELVPGDADDEDNDEGVVGHGDDVATLFEAGKT